MVPNTSDDLPDPETPVNTVNRRLGISTLTSFRLFCRAPWTRIRSWLSAGCWLEEAIFAFMSCRIPSFRFQEPASNDEPQAGRARVEVVRDRLRPRASAGSRGPREQVDELPAHHLPAVARAAEVLLLVRPEARMHEGQARTRRGGREREGHDGVHVADDPRVAELPLCFD